MSNTLRNEQNNSRATEEASYTTQFAEGVAHFAPSRGL